MSRLEFINLVLPTRASLCLVERFLLLADHLVRCQEELLYFTLVGVGLGRGQLRVLLRL